MELSPFRFGNTVSTRAFTNRQNEVKVLYSNLTQGINTMLISPRRWGKSSLVEKVILNIKSKNKDIKVVSIDLFSVADEAEFLEIFAKEVIKASSTKWQDWLQSGAEFFKQLVPKISVGVDPNIEFSLTFDWQELKKHKDEVLNLPETIAVKKDLRFVICLDEFQNLANFDEFEKLEKTMRAVWQRQKGVTYCLYGSKRHMMTDIFNNSSKPFYRFGDILLLQKIKRDKWVSFIEKSFKDTGKLIQRKDAGIIAEVMKDHSWYVQQFSHYVWQKTKKEVRKEDIQSSLEELINANSPLYQREVEALSSTQLNLLKAIARGEKKLSSAKVLNAYKLGTSASVTKNKAILSNADIIDDQSGKFEFLDPAFEIWFLNQYYNKPISAV